MDRDLELARLSSLRNLKILDTLPSESFDRITRIVSQFFGLPVAAVSLTDVDRQWFKSKVGIEHNQIPRFKAPCAEVAQTCQPLVINDFQKDDYYIDSPLGQSGVRFYAGVPLITPDGHGLGALCVLDTKPHAVGEREMTVLTDMAAMVMAQIEMQHAVGRIEAVSGLPNRFQLLSDLADICKHGGKEPRLICVLDLAQTLQFDRLARVMGPSHLDTVIRAVAQFLQNTLDQQTLSYHVGPMQFALLPSAMATAEGLLPAMQQLLGDVGKVADLRMTMTPSIGLTWFNPQTTKPEDVLRSMQGAVQDARNSETGVAFFSDDRDLMHRRNFRLLQDFPRALQTPDELHLVFQPRLSLETGKVECAEALLRWTHPELGSVSPAEFVPIIEASNQVRAMSAWVIDNALKHLSALQEEGVDLKLSINISALNLNEPEFLELLLEKLELYAVRPGHIEFELTETAVMSETEKSLDLLHALRDHGVRLAIDDFGTGYSSLAYMQKLPADVVKIDRSFVADMANGNRERVLVHSMINLSRSLGYRVVAEGVETLEAADLLQAMGCDEIQGFWLSRPMAVDLLSDWLQRRRNGAQQQEDVA
ncbi:sensor domain-containing phosphodiesterase [Allorhizobium taibaishanense]|uniref:Diguanylate phosphodiesterase n=1 Tax=Allorhizobium taibaishanense TaxID=887144 RepID=A0A1Q8ZYX0_9HYPH|nr:sensor domain-containing phosphodiesterase [Allorhizobium taibaishanense]MBB4007522.1 EAL domain-containing protein (putative c-di-GMP-specific phosphodiesterase class I)/GGDEF domain-containing protein [Allorhizobium taibaishanense]OLP47532.1 diguanylate phosphodiesterase [Allorhizobium taibaishanense]